MLRLSAGTAVIDGSLNSDGTLPPPGVQLGGSGAGGSVILRVGALSGAGAITARGPQVREATGGGGGGLILVVSDTSAFSGVLAAGGLGKVDGAPGVVTLRTEASAPSIVSTPPRRARIGQSYGYVPTATGTRPLSWSLAAPTGASIDNDTGALSWTPPSQGAFPFELVVTNAFGAATQRFELAVPDEADDGAPRFLSTPSTAAHFLGYPTAPALCAPPESQVRGRGPSSCDRPSTRRSPRRCVWSPRPASSCGPPPAPRPGTHAVEFRATGPSGVARQVFAVVVECDARLAVGCGCAGPQLRSAPPPWWLVLGLVGLLVRLHAPRGQRKPLNSRRNAPPCA